MADLRRWLESLQLDKYYGVFVENRIDSDVLPELTESDLEKLRIPLGDRKRLLRAIRDLHATARSGTRDAALKRAEAVEASQLRHLTIVFVDLVDSTSLSEKLDLEDYRDTITSYQLCCTNAVRNYKGYVAQYLGDGMLAYFGYPRASEDDAERAVAAGLEIARAVGRLETGQALKLEARVGIATGRVLVTELAKGHLEFKDTALGDIPNLAARLQALARPGSVMVADSTRRLLGNNFDCVSAGNLHLKGFSAPVTVWQVRAMRQAVTRFDSRRKGPMTPFTGRDEELTLLLNRWRATCNGEGRATLIAGEAGIGKSRLIESFCEQIKSEPFIRLRHQCSPNHTNSAFHPIITQIAYAAKIEHGDTNQTKLDKLEDLLAYATKDVARIAPLFARLLSIPDEGRYQLLDESPEAIKELTKAALLDQAFGLAELRPVVMIFEDIHWIDPSTEELLGILIDQIVWRRILILCTCRPEYEASWAGKGGVSTIIVSRLDHRQCIDMIGQIAADHDLPNEIAESIAAKTEGVPLFIEEMTRSVIESRIGKPHKKGLGAAKAERAPSLPSSLNELLMARLDSLSDGKEIVPLCAAVGRSFSALLLSSVSEIPEERLHSMLDKLVKAQVLVQRGHWPDAIYAFRHALIQEAAYSTILKSRLKTLHEEIAKALVSRLPEDVSRNPEIVAFHFGKAEIAAESRDYWTKAAEIAIERSAFLEAISHLEAALAENEKIPDEEEQAKHEISLREKLVVPLEAHFWGSEDIARNLERLHQLQTEYGGDKERFRVQEQLYGTHVIGGKADLALGYALKMAAIAESQEDPAFAMLSQHAIAMCHFTMGNFDSALEHFAKAIELSARASQDIVKQYYLAEVGVIDHCMRAWACVLSEGKSKGAKVIAQAMAVTEATDHDFSRAYGFSILASAHQSAGDAVATRDCAERALQISREKNFRYWVAWARIMRGWAMAATDDREQGIEELLAGLDAYIGTGSKQIVGYAKTLLADAYSRAGRINSGLALIEEIEAAAQQGTVRFHLQLTQQVAAALKISAAQANAGRGS